MYLGGSSESVPLCAFIANTSSIYSYHQLVDNRVNQRETGGLPRPLSYQGAPRHRSSSAVLHHLRIDPNLMCILVFRLGFSICLRSLLVGFLADASSPLLHPWLSLSVFAWSREHGDGADEGKWRPRFSEMG